MEVLFGSGTRGDLVMGAGRQPARMATIREADEAVVRSHMQHRMGIAAQQILGTDHTTCRPKDTSDVVAYRVMC